MRVKRGGMDALDDAGRGAEGLRYRPEDQGNPAEAEDGPRGARTPHRAVTGAALEDRARPDVPDAAHTAADLAGVQRRARLLLRLRAREADRRRRQAQGSPALSGDAGLARRRLRVRVARLHGGRAAPQQLLRGLLSRPG